MSNEKEIIIKLTNDEALVLFEFLGRLDEIEKHKIYEDQAEQRVLWNIECFLEKQLTEPFEEDYSKIIEAARDNVRDKE